MGVLHSGMVHQGGLRRGSIGWMRKFGAHGSEQLDDSHVGFYKVGVGFGFVYCRGSVQYGRRLQGQGLLLHIAVGKPKSMII